MRGDKFMKAVVITLCCVVAAYLVFSVTNFSGDTFTTYKAVLYEVGDGITTPGFVVRSDLPVTVDTQDIVVLTRGEGEKVGKGQALAATFRDEAARSRQSQIDRLEEELAQMEYAYSFSASDLESATLDTDILRLMNQVAVHTARRDFSFADGSAEQLKPYILRRYITGTDSQALRERIDGVKSQLNDLYAQARAESGSILAPASGYFSGAVDGYEEELTPAFLETATVSELAQYEGLGKKSTDALCKLVTSPKWYFAAIVPSVNVAELRAGSRIDVNFAYDFYQTVRMKVERISPAENGNCILVLSSESYISEAVSTRTQTADLIFADKSGLRVPKSAIYADEQNRSGVYVLVGAEARWKFVEVLYDNGESYIVKLDQSSTSNLWPEDEIILTTGEIFNGKVMVQ